MKIAVLTLSGSRYGLRLLNALERAGRPVDTVFVLDDPPQRRWRLLRRVAQRVGWRDAVVSAVLRQLSELGERRSRVWRGFPLITDYGQLAREVVRVSSVRDGVVARELGERRIDLLLLGQSGIVPENVLSASKLGTLNAHPGWLPDYRGIDCHLWTVYERDFERVGSTLHLVDAGVDTGGVIARRAYEWRGDETLHSLEGRLYEDCIDLLLDGVRRADGEGLAAARQSEGRYCHKFPRRERATARRNLERFVGEGRSEENARVLFAVHSATRGGAQLMALKDAEHLSRSYDLVVSIPRGPLSDAFGRTGTLIRRSPRVPVWTTASGMWAKQLVRSVLDALRLAVVIRRRGIRAVMVNSVVLISPVIAARLAGVPVIVHARETPTTRAGELVFAFHEFAADTVICVSGAVESHLQGRRRARVTRIPDGIDIPPEPSSKLNGFQSPLRLAVIGAVNGAWSKGQDVAVEALGLLAERGIDASLEVVGPIQEKGLADHLLGLAADHGVADRVLVRGSTDSVDEVIRGSDIVLTCSRIEPLGLVPAEALARGRPVVATRVGGLPEVVREGETGLLVPPGDPDALADAVATLVADPAAARTMAASGRLDVEKRFDTRVARARVGEELARLLTGSDRRVEAPEAWRPGGR